MSRKKQVDNDFENMVDVSKLEYDVKFSYTDKDILMIDDARLMSAPIPVRLPMNIVAFCKAGRIQWNLNGEEIRFSSNQLLVCPPNTTFEGFMMSPDFEFKAILLSNRMLQSFLREKMNLWTEVLYIHKMHVITFDEDDMQIYVRFYEMMQGIMGSEKQNEYKTEVVHSLLRGAFLYLCGLLKSLRRTDDSIQSRINRSLNIFHQFLDILNNSPVKHHPVEWYASKLCVSPKYLSTICKNNSGKSANDWIRDQEIEDIRYYLKQTDLTMTQIADQLGFPNPSFFGKFVKEHFGMTPIQFRKDV